MPDTTPDPAEPTDAVDAVDDAESTDEHEHGNTRHSTAGVEEKAESYGDAPHGAELPATDFPTPTR